MPVLIHSSSFGERCAGFFEVGERVLSGAEDRGKIGRALGHVAARGRVRLSVASRDGEPVARLVTQVSPAYSDSNGDPLGLIGFFEAVDDPEAVRELFDAAAEELRGAGCRTMIGPIEGDTWHRYRVNAGPFERPPFLLEPTNPQYYASLWEGSGFSVLESYSSKRIAPIAETAAALSRKFDAARANGYRFERFDRDDFRSVLERIYSLSIVIFKDNFLYSDISFEEFAALYDGADRLMDEDSIVFARTSDGEDAGFLFAYPNRTASAPHGDALNFKTLGVLPEHRRGGTGGALMYCGYESAMRRGIDAANHCLMREGNPSERLDSGHGETFRRYFLYQKGIA